MSRIPSADQDNRVGVSLNDITKSYQRKLIIERWRTEKALQSEKKKKDVDVIQQAHARLAGITRVKIKTQVLGKRPNQEQGVQQTPSKRSIRSSRVNIEKDTFTDGTSSNSVIKL